MSEAAFQGQVVSRELPIVTFQIDGRDDQFVALALRYPRMPHELCWGQVHCRPPQLGGYLQPTADDDAQLAVFVDFHVERLPLPVELAQARVTKVRLVINRDQGRWRRDYQRLVLIHSGTIFSLVDVFLNQERLVVHEFTDGFVSLRGAFDPYPPEAPPPPADDWDESLEGPESGPD